MRFAALFLLLPFAAAAGQADTIRVGAPALRGLSLPLGVDTTHVYMVRANERRHIMTYVEETVRTPDGYRIIGENVRPTGQSVTLDTVVVSPSLEPIWHADRTPRGSRHVRYAGGRLVGTATDTTGLATPIDFPARRDALDYSMASGVINLLPLRAGYAGVLLTHDVTRGPVNVPFRVVGEETVTVKGVASEAWKVEVAINPATTTTRWISKATRKDLRTVVPTPNGEMVVE